MVKLVARHQVTNDGKTYKAGSVFEIDEDGARRLIKLNAAMPAEESAGLSEPEAVVDATEVDRLQAEIDRLHVASGRDAITIAQLRDAAQADGERIAELDATVAELQQQESIDAQTISDLSGKVGELEAQAVEQSTKIGELEAQIAAASAPPSSNDPVADAAPDAAGVRSRRRGVDAVGQVDAAASGGDPANVVNPADVKPAADVNPEAPGGQLTMPSNVDPSLLTP